MHRELNRPLLMLPSQMWRFDQRPIKRTTGGVSLQTYMATVRGPAPIDVIVRREDGAFVAVLQLHGTLYQHQVNAADCTSCDLVGSEFRKLVAMPSIRTIIFDIHSYGGQTWGARELADTIYNARSSDKRIISVINSCAAGSALWIATAAQQVVVTPGGEIGGLGVVVAHQDFSKAEQMQGTKTTLLAYPERKIQGHEFAPLDKAAHTQLQAEVRATYSTFVGAVARNRNVSNAMAVSRFGKGGMLRADEAVKVGLADRVASLHDIVNREVGRLQSGRKSVANQLAILRLRGSF
jgi:ClpP class serine protease